MTLKEFFELLAENPAMILAYFLLIPFTAFLAGIMGKNEGHIAPWKYLYSTLLYLVCVPGIFAITLNVYLFLFEQRSVFETDVYTQILPILSMVATLLITRNNVDLERIPGFGKLSGLVMIIFATVIIMWFLEKTRIIVFSYLKIEYFLLILVGLLIAIRFGWSKLIKPTAAS